MVVQNRTTVATTNTHTHKGTTERLLQSLRRSQEVIKFLETCGEPNLQFLTRPARLKKALEVLDEDGSGEIDIHEWRVARRPPRFHVARDMG